MQCHDNKLGICENVVSLKQSVLVAMSLKTGCQICCYVLHVFDEQNVGRGVVDYYNEERLYLDLDHGDNGFYNKYTS